jgi:zinc protease
MIKRIFIILLLTLILHFIFVNSVLSDPEANVVQSTLKNGLRVAIIKNTLAPVVTVQMNYLVGANEDPAGLNGTAHAQEHMMFRGSPGLSAEQLSAIIAGLGGAFNADTQQTITQYTMTVPNDALDIALHVEATRMKNVLNSQELWELERGAIEQEVAQDLSNPMYIFYTKLNAELFRDTPYAHTALGSRESLNKITAELLRKFHQDWYAPNNAILVIAGNVSTDQTLKAVMRLFEEIPARPLPPRPDFKLKPLKAATITLETDLSYGLAVVGYRLPGFESPDYATAQILGDILSSKRGNLYALVTEGKALKVDADIDMLPKAAIGTMAAAFPKGCDGAALIASMKKIITDYLEHGFPEELVEAAKRLEIADYEFQKNSVEDLATLWSQTLSVSGRSPDDDLEAIRRVTVADVNRVARKYFVNDTAVTAILEPRQSGKAIPSKRKRGKESFAPKQTKKVNLPIWARKASLLPPVPVLPARPVATLLPNGLRLIVLPQNVSRSISVFGQIRNQPGLQVPKGKEGIDRVLDSLFGYGTTTLDRISFQRALDDIAAIETAGTDFSLQVLTENFDRGVQLLADNLLNPSMPESAFRTVQRQTAGELAGLLQSPSYMSQRALRAALYPANNPILRQATPDTVAALTLEDIRNYHRAAFRPDMTTIVIIGQVTPGKAETVIKKHFGRWKARGAKPETYLPAAPPNKASTTIIPDTSRVQDQVILTELLALKRSHPDFYKLQLGSQILSGGFYASRLYQDLRARTGLVYHVEARLEGAGDRSIFTVEYACDPPNVSKARSIVERNLMEMRTRSVSDWELLQAKTLLIHQLSLSEANVEGIARRLLDYALEDLPLNETSRAIKHYRRISASELRAAFRKWIRLNDLVQITIGPNPE